MPRNSDIQNPAAYDEAIKRRIKANASKGRHDRWHAEDATRLELTNWMADQSSPFIVKMMNSYLEWGSLTANQEAAVRKSRDDMVARKMAREQAHVAKHVGVVGARQTFILTVKRVAGFEGTFGWVSVYSMEDSDGNVVVYKGSTVWEGVKAGDVITVKGTIKEHGEYKGLAQTYISRPIKL